MFVFLTYSLISDNFVSIHVDTERIISFLAIRVFPTSALCAHQLCSGLSLAERLSSSYCLR